MTQSNLNHSHFAKILTNAAHEKKDIPRFTIEYPELTLEDGYKIQNALVKQRLELGEKIVGYKMGLTSKAKMQQMGVHEPIMGTLTSAMLLPSNGTAEMKKFIHPKVEPEIAFLLKDTIECDRSVLSHEEFLGSCAAIMPALEIIDSRYLNFDFKLPDVLADNCSASGFVLGEKFSPRHCPIDQITMELEINGMPSQKGISSAILGHPIDSCLALLALLKKQGKHLAAGSIILAGSATAAASIPQPAHIHLKTSNLGNLSIDFY